MLLVALTASSGGASTLSSRPADGGHTALRLRGGAPRVKVKCAVFVGVVLTAGTVGSEAVIHTARKGGADQQNPQPVARPCPGRARRVGRHDHGVNWLL